MLVFWLFKFALHLVAPVGSTFLSFFFFFYKGSNHKGLLYVCSAL